MPKCLVPAELLIPIGAQATKDLGKCCDNWLDSEVAVLRAMLPITYHNVPLDHLRMCFIKLRKDKAPGFLVSGHGPRKGSRLHPKGDVTPEYAAYLSGEDGQGWPERRQYWLDRWGKCALCSSTERLVVHHNTYERLGHELPTDCVVLCKKHHDWFHATEDEEDDADSNGFKQESMFGAYGKNP